MWKFELNEIGKYLIIMLRLIECRHVTLVKIPIGRHGTQVAAV